MGRRKEYSPHMSIQYLPAAHILFTPLLGDQRSMYLSTRPPRGLSILSVERDLRMNRLLSLILLPDANEIRSSTASGSGGGCVGPILTAN